MKRLNKFTVVPLLVLITIISISPGLASTPKPTHKVQIKVKKFKSPTPAIQAAAIARYETQFNIPSALIQSDASLQALMTQAIGPFNNTKGTYSSPMPLKSWIWNYYQSKFFQSSGASEILAEVVRLGSPCDYITAYNNTISYLQNLAITVGGQLSNIGQPESCGAVHYFNTAWPDTYYTNDTLAPGETVADWLLHGSMYFWKNYNPSILQDQYQLHPWLWFYPTGVGLDYSSPGFWSSPEVLKSFNYLAGMQDNPKLVSQLIYQAAG